MILRISQLLLLLTVLSLYAFLITGCSYTQPENPQNKENPIISTTAKTENKVVAPEKEPVSTDTYIILDNDKTTINGYGAAFENNTVTITDGGVYHLTGSLSDGRIYINSNNETKKVKLVLEGVNVNCSTDAPLYIENSPDETVLILATSTENYFSDTAREIPVDVTDYATAVIYSKDDLQIEGDGALNVNANFNKGIFSKNDIDIHGGQITVHSADDGIRGKQSVEIESGIIELVCGGDGIRTNEENDPDKGHIEINGGTIKITSDLDGIQATGPLTVNGGEITVKSAGGSTEAYTYTENHRDSFYGKNMGFPLDGKSPESSIHDKSAVNEPSKKAIKSDKSITLNAGILSLDSPDDCIHAPKVSVNNAEITASSNDDGIHADEKTDINGGKINITASYEGVEGNVINITNGEIYINSSDDGFNAASGSTAEQGSNFGGMFENDESCIINMQDGFVLINAQGDGIDSNGSINMTGGRMVVFGPTNRGNGALDYGGSFNVSGGTLFACGSLGMAQSVTGNGVKVESFNYDGSAGSFYAFTDSNNNCKFAFTSPKNFQNVVLATDSISSSETITFHQGGSVTSQNNSVMGIYFDGNYSPETVINTLS